MSIILHISYFETKNLFILVHSSKNCPISIHRFCHTSLSVYCSIKRVMTCSLVLCFFLSLSIYFSLFIPSKFFGGWNISKENTPTEIKAFSMAVSDRAIPGRSNTGLCCYSPGLKTSSPLLLFLSCFFSSAYILPLQANCRLLRESSPTGSYKI